MDVRFINEQTIMIYFENKISEETYRNVTAMVRWIREKEILEIQDIVPSYRAVLIYFDEQAITSSKLIENLELNKFNEKNVHAVNQTNRIIKIPVQYGGTYGPDIEEVAKHNRITVEQVIEKHTSKPYLIYMLGFMPGFPYLGGLDEQLHTPRRNQPRLKIHAGSVGIANNQTGLYPSDSPGGWQIIGRTPLKVFSSEREPMSMYEAGEWIQFYAIDEQKFIQIERDISDGNFNVDDWVVIEYTLIGPTIQFNTQNTFVITGGSINASLNNKTISMNSVILAEKGDILKIGAITKGARGYLTFGHSINVPSIAESYATHTRSSIGGFKGRKLLADDVITVKINNDFKENIGKTIHLQDDLLPENNIIHILQGPQFEAFSEEARAKIVNHPYLITEQSDRMGYRLEGDSVAPINQADIISEPVALGSVQVPNDGQPIILLNDKQTIGGYTKIATVCKFDLPKLAQMKPQDTIQFKWISFQEAVDKNREQMSLFNEILKSHQKTPIFDTSSLRHTSKKLATILKGDL